MREQLIQYVNLLFAGAADAEDMKQEILQNTLDRYDDLIVQDKTPEAAYRLAISGIGDINEILGSGTVPGRCAAYASAANPVREESDRIHHRILRAVAIALYILCPIPLFILSDAGMSTVGLCGTIAIVAVATVLLLLGKQKDSKSQPQPQVAAEINTPRRELDHSIGNIISIIGLVIYFVLSFTTGAWYITWLIFPIMGAVRGLVRAIMDLKEESHHEA